MLLRVYACMDLRVTCRIVSVVFRQVFEVCRRHILRASLEKLGLV